jgi:hypothetical protein
MYEINPVATSSQTSIATNMVSTSSTNVFAADQRIAALEQEIFNLRNAKRTFDGVEILKPAHANKPNPTEQPKAPESTTKPAPPPEKPTTTTQPPLHPFANIAGTSYQPPHERNFAAAPAKPGKEKEPAYHYVAPIQNPRTVVDVYNKSMQTPHITLSPEELYAISPEVCNRLRKAITPKQVLNEMVSTHALIEQVPDDEETSITVPDVYETYRLQENDLYLSMLLKSRMLCGRLQWSSTTERRWKVSLIWDPRLLPCRKRFAMTSAWRTTCPSSSTCSQLTARSTSHSA